MSSSAENSNDYQLAKDMGMFVDELREERRKAYDELRRKMRGKGFNPPEGNPEFLQWMKDMKVWSKHEN